MVYPKAQVFHEIEIKQESRKWKLKPESGRIEEGVGIGTRDRSNGLAFISVEAFATQISVIQYSINSTFVLCDTIPKQASVGTICYMTVRPKKESENIKAL